MEKNNENVKIAYEKGYRVVDGKVISPNGLDLRLQFCGNRPRFRIRNGQKTFHVYVARLAGYQKFGEKIFDENLHLCHKNGNPKDNCENNLILGTFTEAQNTKNNKAILNKSILNNNRKNIIKLKKEEILALRNSGITYFEIMKYMGINSKRELIKLIL